MNKHIQEDPFFTVNHKKKNKSWLALASLLSIQTFFISPTLANDPCDFASSGDIAFSYDQVMSCYKTVPFNAADRDNIVDTVVGHIDGKSTLRGNYDARNNWRTDFANIKATTYDDDYSLQYAILGAFINFKNFHFGYAPPLCYTGALMTYFKPLLFGSTVQNGEQIIFVESNAIRPDVYQQYTGIDTSPLVGQKLVSVDGIDALEFFRQWTREFHRGDDSDGAALNFVLGGDYGLPFADKKPNRASYTYVFEEKSGKQTTLELPWLFTQASTLLPGISTLPLTNNSQEFEALCTLPNPVPSGGARAAHDEIARAANLDVDKIHELRDIYHDHYKLRKLIHTVQSQYKTNRLSKNADFFEVPPGQFNQYVKPIAQDSSSGISILEYRNDTTVIKIPDFYSSDDFIQWAGMIAQGTSHACENSDRLILDIRNNFGGNLSWFTWAVRHFFPDRSLDPARGSFVIRNVHTDFNTENMVFNAYFLNGAQLYSGEPLSSCLGVRIDEREYGPFDAYACAIDVTTNDIFLNTPDPFGDYTFIGLTLNPIFGLALLPINQGLWFYNTSQELRGGDIETVTPLWTLDYRGIETVFLNACPGKFSKDKLIVLTDGRNASGGYFFPEKLDDEVTIVTTGGYLGEGINYGNARGGNVISVNYIVDGLDFAYGLTAELNDFLGFNFYPEVMQYPLPGFTRDVDASYEEWGAYTKDLQTLTIDSPAVPHLQVPVWNVDPMGDGFVYKKVIQAVEGQ